MATKQEYTERNVQDYFISEEPFYVPTSDEIEIFESAYRQRIPILLKGPTGTGKTRFVEHMAWRLSEGLTPRNSGEKSRNGTSAKLPPLRSPATKT